MSLLYNALIEKMALNREATINAPSRIYPKVITSSEAAKVTYVIIVLTLEMPIC